MFKLITLVTVAVAFASLAGAQNCASNYGQYLQCIKGKLDADYCGAEAEFGGDYRRLLLNCFTTDASKSNDKCFINEPILSKAFDSDGPLKGCNICITAARLVKGLFLTAKDSVMQCIRKTITKAVGQEIETCIKAKKPDFSLPPLPDFDEKSGPCRDAMLNSTGLYVVADWKLKFCAIQTTTGGGGRARRSAATASNSQQCIASRKVNGKEIWQKECSTMKDCRQPFGTCKADFEKVETISCGCIETKRVEVQKKIDDAGAKFNDIVAKAGSVDPNEAKCNACDGKDGCSGLVKWKTCQCVQTATNLLDSNSQPGHPSLRQLLKDVIACAQDSEASQSADVDSLLKTLCFRVAQDGPTGTDASAQLKIAINFIKSLFDALVLRVQRYCPGNHCPGTGSV